MPRKPRDLQWYDTQIGAAEFLERQAHFLRRCARSPKMKNRLVKVMIDFRYWNPDWKKEEDAA